MNIVQLVKTPKIVDKEFAERLKSVVETHINLKPLWFCEFDFRFNPTEAEAIAEFTRYQIKVATNIKPHLLSIPSVGLKDGRRHLHAIICGDGEITYRDLHKRWRSGHSYQQTYRFGDTGIEYICDISRGHKFIEGFTPFCNHRGKCGGRKGCVYQRGKEY